jgi:DNA-binding response OmpR family regulator
MAKILILEDDKLFNETLQDFLEEDGYDVYFALDPYSALDITYNHNFDLYLFDVNIPYENGFELLKKLRDSGDMTPTIFITSRDDKSSLNLGFLVGADDYIKKPIDLDELQLRILAILRRTTRRDKIEIDGYSLDYISKRVTKDNQDIEFNNKTVEFLYILLEANGEVVSFDNIEDRLWTTAKTSSRGALRVYATQIKKHFPHRIKNIRGVGYYFEQ